MEQLKRKAAAYTRRQFPTTHRLAAFKAYQAGYLAAKMEALEVCRDAMRDYPRSLPR
jgi:hypothetical protein